MMSINIHPQKDPPPLLIMTQTQRNTLLCLQLWPPHLLQPPPSLTNQQQHPLQITVTAQQPTTQQPPQHRYLHWLWIWHLLRLNWLSLKMLLLWPLHKLKTHSATTLRDAKRTTSPPETTLTVDQMDSDPDADQLTPQDLQSFICDLKHELASLFIKTRAMIQQQSLPQPTTKHSQPKT